MLRLVHRLALHIDRWHLRWGMREIDQRHPDVEYIVARGATIEQKLFDLSRCHCAQR